MRFTLNGIVSYNWSLQLINASDAAPDFVGTASYSASGFGYIGLICQLLTGSASFAERIVKTATCCEPASQPWYDSWYGIGAYSDPSNPDVSADTPYLNAFFDYEEYPQATPLNVPASLTYHANFDESYEPTVVEADEDLNSYYWTH